MTQFDEQVFCFQGKTFIKALSDWVDEQVKVYPHKEEEIRIVQLAMLEFMNSSQVKNHKMLVESLAKQKK